MHELSSLNGAGAGRPVSADTLRDRAVSGGEKIRNNVRNSAHNVASRPVLTYTRMRRLLFRHAEKK
ncbi:hypothetical protein [Undibacterium sp.]|uniref:hypothetical protein n=1 Tax=Undibacterium sp. TaxID=1914977 RepID=UPI00374D022A